MSQQDNNHGVDAYQHPLIMDTDESFMATPLKQSPATSPKIAFADNPTFMQNQIAIQRSPSTARDQASALSRSLSIKSNSNHDNTQPGIASHLSDSYKAEPEPQGRERGDSDSSFVEAINQYAISKSPSELSAKSSKSVKSVRSVHAVGSYPIGTLRIHSPSPTRTPGGHLPDARLKTGDVLIFRDVPAGSLLGYDTIAFTVNGKEAFDGIREIPAGTHFIWGGSNTNSMRNGFWIFSAKRASDEYGAIHVRRWDNDNEVLEEEISMAEVRIQKESLPEIFDKLQPYTIGMQSVVPTPLNSVSSPSTSPVASEFSTTGALPQSARDPSLWFRLTNSIKASLLNKIMGKKDWNEWRISSGHDNRNSSPDDDAKISAYGEEILSFMFPVNKRTFSEESTGRARSLQATDPTHFILTIIDKHCSHQDSDEIIGELQFCYVTGMLLGNVSCMEHWAYVVKTFFRAYSLITTLPEFARKFIWAIHAQFVYDSEGLEGSILDFDPNLRDELKMVLTTYKARLNEMLLEAGAKCTKEQTAVGDAFGNLEALLWKWEWDLRADYVRKGQYQTEDGHWVDAELTEFQDEDERGPGQFNSSARHMIKLKDASIPKIEQPAKRGGRMSFLRRQSSSS